MKSSVCSPTPHSKIQSPMHIILRLIRTVNALWRSLSLTPWTNRAIEISTIVTCRKSLADHGDCVPIPFDFCTGRAPRRRQLAEFFVFLICGVKNCAPSGISLSVLDFCALAVFFSVSVRPDAVLDADPFCFSSCALGNMLLIPDCGISASTANTPAIFWVPLLHESLFVRYGGCNMPLHFMTRSSFSHRA